MRSYTIQQEFLPVPAGAIVSHCGQRLLEAFQGKSVPVRAGDDFAHKIERIFRMESDLTPKEFISILKRAFPECRIVPRATENTISIVPRL